MTNIQKLMTDTLKLFPEKIDISDGESRSDNGFFSQNLSHAWHIAENQNDISGNDFDFMIWSIFKLLHKISRKNFANGIYFVSINDIDLKELKKSIKKQFENLNNLFS